MFAIFLNFVGFFIGLFFGISVSTDSKLVGVEKWAAYTIASILTAFNAMLLVDNLKTFLK